MKILFDFLYFLEVSLSEMHFALITKLQKISSFFFEK